MISLPKKQQPTAPTRRDEDECRKGGFLLHASNAVNKKITYCADRLDRAANRVRACCMLPWYVAAGAAGIIIIICVA